MATPKKKPQTKPAPAPKKPAAAKPAAAKPSVEKKTVTTKKNVPAAKPAPAKKPPVPAKQPPAPAKKAASELKQPAVVKSAPPPKTVAQAESAPLKKVPQTPAKAATAARPVDPARMSAPLQKKPLSSPLGLQGGAVRGKIMPRQFMIDLALAIKAAVAPMAREVPGREILHTTVSGDATFEIDAVAEKALLSFLRSAKMPVAYYSEDAGYSTFTNAQPMGLLVVDPIDGTRAAKSGFEGCVVAIASTRVIERPIMADIDSACVVEILGDRVFYAERGNGVRMFSDGHAKKPKLSQNTDLERLTWSMTVPARPAELIFPAAARLIDLSSLKGGFFACNSTSFSLTRLLTNQMDAYVDVAQRFMRDIPDVVRDHFINAGRGNVIGIAPYDMVAAVLIAQEAGCVVTDAYGNSLDPVLVLDSSSPNHQSMIAASNRTLHEKLLKFFDTRIRQFEALLVRRAEAARG